MTKKKNPLFRVDQIDGNKHPIRSIILRLIPAIALGALFFAYRMGYLKGMF